MLACESSSVLESESSVSIGWSVPSSLVAAEIKDRLMSRDVWMFGVFPGSQHLFSSGFVCAFLPPSVEGEIAAIAGVDQLCFGLTLRRMEFKVTFLIWVVTEAVVAAAGAGCLASDIKLMM
jgi:hypothetical protein